MQARHRIPSIFNLSMVDVLCCALGCVILLWLINLREAKQRAVAVGETSQRLEAAQRQLDEAKSHVVSLTAERDEMSQRYQAALKERNQLGGDLDKARAALVALDR